jgi:hypothetical protein
MTPRISLITVVAAALVFAVPALGAPSPDAFERAVTQSQQRPDLSTTEMLDARERALATDRGTDYSGVVEARTRAFAAMDRYTATPRPRHEPVVDDRFRIDPNGVPTPVSATSGREIEWPQIGFGVGIGILLALGATLIVRTARGSQVAH